MTDAAHWNKLAGKWASEMWRVSKSDKSGVVLAALTEIAERPDTRSIIDFGCGVGDFLPSLSKLFDRVVGYDSADECIVRAKKLVSRLGNVEVHTSRGWFRTARASFDAMLCVNVLINPSRAKRLKTLQLMQSLLRPDGSLVLVVPSFESASLLSEATNGTFHGRRYAEPRKKSFGLGVLLLGGVPTKHYTEEELTGLLTRAGFSSTEVKKVPYSWKSHRVGVVRGLGEGPWDWLATARLSK